MLLFYSTVGFSRVGCHLVASLRFSQSRRRSVAVGLSYTSTLRERERERERGGGTCWDDFSSRCILHFTERSANHVLISHSLICPRDNLYSSVEVFPALISRTRYRIDSIDPGFRANLRTSLWSRYLSGIMRGIKTIQITQFPLRF